MKIKNVFRDDIRMRAGNDYLTGREFKESVTRQNADRGRLLAIVTIAFEAIFLMTDAFSAFLKVDRPFAFYTYFAMYSVMIAINAVFLFLIDRFNRNRISVRAMREIITVYLVSTMSWGSIVTLMDQKLYAQLVVFMINMIVSSVIYLLDEKRMCIPYLISTLILAAGLPFFQSSGDVLIGHYVNLLVFVVISWIASRIGYRSYCESYVNKKLMEQSESLLKKEMEEKRVINEKLAAANAQLKKMALLDELTGLQNRRSFYEFIDMTLRNDAGSNLTASVLMIDIDYFKQYNDLYGHEKGDLALTAVANQIASMVENRNQIAVRWGGEEFIYVAFDKSRDDIIKIGDAVRLKILKLKIPNPGSAISPYITVSSGACTGNAASVEDINALIKIADQTMYQAKNSGRNCVASRAAINAQ